MEGSWEEVIKEKRERRKFERNLRDKVDSKVWRKRRNVVEETKVGESLSTCEWQAAWWRSAQPCFKGSADSLACLCVRKEPTELP